MNYFYTPLFHMPVTNHLNALVRQSDKSFQTSSKAFRGTKMIYY